MSSKLQTVNLTRKPTKSITPTKTSKMTTIIEMVSACGSKKGKSKTPELKYSSSLKEKPTGSFNLIKPLIIKSIPTNILEKLTRYFML